MTDTCSRSARESFHPRGQAAFFASQNGWPPHALSLRGNIRGVWTPGETIVWQETWKGRIWAARPVTVVLDTPEFLLVWLPHQTVRKVPDGRAVDPNYPALRKDRIIADLMRGDWDYREHQWDVSTLMLLRPGDWFGVWTSWEPSGEHLGYYINLQMPYKRTSLGIEAMDLMLDITATPDRSWRWKDDDEFDEIVARGIYGPDLAQQIRHEATRALAALSSAVWPFDGRLPEQRPDVTWPLPLLPDGWDRPSE